MGEPPSLSGATKTTWAGLRAGPKADPDGWADRVREHQADEWRAGRRVTVEAFLAELPALADHADLLLDLIYGEVVLRERRGDTVEAAEYRKRFPAHADAIGRQFEVHRALADDGASMGADAKALGQRAASASPKLPELDLPGYEVRSELGRGGSGVVYLAVQEGLDRLVAVKTISATGPDAAGQIARFRGEASALARLRHRNIVQVFEVGDAGRQPFFSMEYAPGGSLAERLEPGVPWPARPAAELLRTLARAAQAAHALGIVHRDLKPANVLLCPEGPGEAPPSERGPIDLARWTPKVTDFGLAKQFGLPPRRGGHTQAGTILGTPLYMAPEQAQGHGEVGPTADVYSLGVILYELATGGPPFRGDNAIETLLRAALDDPEPIRAANPAFPLDLESVCLRCLRKSPAERYPTAQALADDLDRFVRGRPVSTRPVGPLTRLAKWARREPVPAALLAGVLLSLALGLAVSARQWARAERALSTTGTALDRAREAQRETEAARVAEAEARGQAERDRARAVADRAVAEAARAEKTAALADVSRQLDEGRGKIYLGQLALAERAIEGGNYVEAGDLLDDCPEPFRRWEWFYLKRECGGRALCLPAAEADAWHVAVGPDGTLATVGREAHDRTRLWAGGRLVQTLEGHGCAAFGPDGKHVAAGTGKNGVKVWDWEGGAARRERVLEGLAAPARCLAFSDDGKRLAAGSDRGVCVWSVAGGRPLTFADGDRAAHVVGVAFSPDGRQVATTSASHLRLWDAHTGAAHRTYEHVGKKDRLVPFVGKHPRGVTGVAYHPDGKWLVVGCLDHRLYRWDPKAGKPLQNWEAHGATVQAVCFDAAGKAFASVGADGQARVWDAEQPTKEVAHFPGLTGVALSADGRRAFAAQRDRGAVLWTVSPPSPSRELEGKAGTLSLAVPTPSGSLLLSLQADGTLRGWSLGSGKPVEIALPRSALPAPPRAWAADAAGRCLAVACDAGPDGTGGELLVGSFRDGLSRRLSGSVGLVSSLAVSPAGNLVAAGGDDGIVRLWDFESGGRRGELKGHEGEVTGLAFDAVGRLMSAGSDATLRIWNVATQGEIKRWTGTEGFIKLASAPAGPLVAVLDRAGVARLWETAGDREPVVLGGHPGGVSALAFGPAGRRLATVGVNGGLRIWATDAVRSVLALDGPRGTAFLTFDPEGGSLAAVGPDGTVRLWETAGKAR